MDKNLQNPSSLSIFDILARSLSKQERDKILKQAHQEFLEETNQNLSYEIHPLPVETISAHKTDTDLTPSQQLDLQTDLHKLSWFAKLILFFKAIFLQKSYAQTYIDCKLKLLKQSIVVQCNFINFETNAIQPNFILNLLHIYDLVTPLAQPHLQVWENSEMLNRLITRLLYQDQSIPSIKYNPTDFVSFDKLSQIFTQNTNEESVKHAVAKSQQDYLQAIPASAFYRVSHKLLPFYALSILLTYPFKQLFVILGILDQQTGQIAATPIMPVSIFPVLDSLETFYSIILSIVSAPFPRNITEIFFYEAFRKQFSPADDFGLSRAVQQNVLKLDTLLTYMRNFLTRTPMAEIIFYFRNNPYHKVQPKITQLNVSKFYFTSSVVLTANTMPEIMQSIRKTYIDMSINKIFGNMTIEPLKYYAAVENKTWEDVNLHSFLYAQSMMYSHNFLNFLYIEKMENFKDFFNTRIFCKIPSLQIKYNEYSSKIESLRQKIRDLDASVSPLTEEGKNFINLQYSLTDNPKQVSLIQAFINRKDVEAYNLLMAIAKTLQDFGQFIKEKILDNTSEAMQTLLANAYFTLEKISYLRPALQEWSESLMNFSSMLRELTEHEKRSQKP